ASVFLWPATHSRATPRGGLGQKVVNRLAQAGLSGVRPSALVAVSVVLAVVVAALVFALIPVVALAVAAGIVALVAPAIAVEWRARARRKATRVLWPDVVDHLVS